MFTGQAPAPSQRNAPSQPSANAPPKTILLAPGTVALLNMYNAPGFFSGKGFRTWEDMHREGARKEGAATIDFMGNQYLLTDKLPKGSGWKSVVAVVVNGKPWQFKDFPFKVCGLACTTMRQRCCDRVQRMGTW